MKKVIVFLFVLFVGINFNSIAQTTPKDFYAGKWEVSVLGTPNGDAKFVTELIRKDGKLTGELNDPSGKLGKPIPLSKVEEENNKLIFYFTTNDGYDVSVVLAKVDDNNLKGSTLDQFDTTASRVKN